MPGLILLEVFTVDVVGFSTVQAIVVAACFCCTFRVAVTPQSACTALVYVLQARHIESGVQHLLQTAQVLSSPSNQHALEPSMPRQSISRLARSPVTLRCTTYTAPHTAPHTVPHTVPQTVPHTVE